MSKIREILETLITDFTGREKSEWERGDDKPIFQAEKAILEVVREMVPDESEIIDLLVYNEFKNRGGVITSSHDIRQDYFDIAIRLRRQMMERVK